MRRILVTSALPYANGSIHLGHLVEYIQTDIWVRFQKMLGHKLYYICADDTHGTPIMLRAEKEGIKPEDLIFRIGKEHTSDFNNFLIDFDYYGSTNNQETREIANDIYLKLKNEAKLISKKSVEQFYDPKKLLFLPDRYVKGTCPKCKSEDQYGDSCENCGATYSPTELINPISAISGSTPIKKKSEHYFFKLSDLRCEQFLKEWTSKPDTLQVEAKNKIQEWFEAGFSDWDISRDAPYFGFEIPDTPGKYFYVWLDAPIGYFGSFKQFCKKNDLDFEAFVCAKKAKQESTEMIHFIGKDILYFHALFFPALLEFSGYRTPSQIFAHGFLTVNGKKMSKSRGTFITADTYIKNNLNPEWLRYYYFSKLNSSLQDIDLNLEDFALKVNGDLVGKYINIASRSAKFINQHFHNTLVSTPNSDLLNQIRDKAQIISRYYEEREFSKALREIMKLADDANQFIDREKPWKLAQDEKKKLHSICSTSLEAFRLLTLYLKPVLPFTAEKVESFLNIAPLTWHDIGPGFKNNHVINSYTHLMQRVGEKNIKTLVNSQKFEKLSNNELASAKKLKKNNVNMKNTNLTNDDISIEEFKKVKLKVARIVKAEVVEGADKLLKLQLDLGEKKYRQVFAGIKQAYSAKSLEGKLTVVAANLKPRKMRFGISEGMILAASGDEEDIFLISPDSGAKPGMEVR